MIEHARPSPAFRFCLDPGQVINAGIRITATGPGVALFHTNADTSPPPDDPHAITPDPVLFLADRIADGFFAAAYPEGPPPALLVHDRSHAAADTRQTWDVTLQNLYPGTCRVLANMLVARGMTQISIDAPGAQDSDPTTLPYPPLSPDPPFQIDYLRPANTGRERSIEIALATVPDAGSLDLVYDILDRWSQLLLLGAYPRDGQSPLAAGLMPDLAIRVAPDTVLQGIDIAFACDELAFVPLIQCFQTGQGRSLPLRQITIR